jgi:hypothetical protein
VLLGHVLNIALCCSVLCVRTNRTAYEAMLTERAAALSGRSTVVKSHSASSLLVHSGTLTTTTSGAVSGGLSEEPSLPTAEVLER